MQAIRGLFKNSIVRSGIVKSAYLHLASGKRARGSLIIAIAVGAGLAIGFLLAPRPEDSEVESYEPRVQLLGSPLPLDATAPERARARVRGYLRGHFNLELTEGNNRSFSFADLGASLDKVRLARLVRDAKDKTSPLSRLARGRDARQPVELPVPVVLDTDEALKRLMLLKDDFDRLPADARLDLKNKKLIKEVIGQRLDVDATLLAMSQAIERGKGQAHARFVKKKPRRVAADLSNVKFNHVLGYFETGYNRSEKYEARTYNLRLAASKLDGYVLLPGEVFDFNQVVGPRDEANGYKVAKVIAEGELVDGIGGGTCQISGTLHGAGFFAGLEIVERYPHTRPSGYIKMGLDATVVYPTIDFRMKNSFDFPVVLHETVKDGVVRAEVLGPKKQPTVTLIRRILQALPYEELERPDNGIPSGVRVLSQRGVPGFKLRRYRIVRWGKHAVRQRWDDTYPPTPQIIRVGIGPHIKDQHVPQGDATPEYVADELLVMTQGPDITADGAPSTIETREKGVYGERGWTLKLGMPYFKTASDS